MEGQLPLIDGSADGTEATAWQLADDVRLRGLRGIHEARRALEEARRRRVVGDVDPGAGARRAA